MNLKRCRIALVYLLVLLVIPPLLLADEQPTVNSPQKGTDLGNYVPTMTTWFVVSPTLAKYNGNNTCLAGVYRKEKVISIYAQTKAKDVWDLLHAVDRALQDHPEIKAYIVINKPLRGPRGVNHSAARFAETRALAQTHKFKHVDVSLCRSPSKLLFDENTLIKFVYSENRIVKLSRKFPKTDQSLKEAAALIEAVLKYIPTANAADAPRSGNGENIQVLFENKSKSKIKLYWIGYNGEHKLYGELDPDGTRRQNSYENNTWLITDKEDNPLGYFICGATAAVAVIPE